MLTIAIKELPSHFLAIQTNRKVPTLLKPHVYLMQPFIIAESPITTIGLLTPNGNQWIIKTIDHNIADGLYIATIEAEIKV